MVLRRIIGNENGIAILITLLVITVLIATTLELNRKVRSEISFSAISRDRMTLAHMATSGLNAAMAMLVRDKMDSDTDSLQEDWADRDKIDEVLQDIPFEEGKLDVIISDELSRIQINALVIFPEGREFNNTQLNLWDRFLRNMASEDESLQDVDPTAIINSLKDWLDSGDDEAITGLSGAESDYYEGLDLPYSCGNRPFTYLDELALVKGISKNLLYGTDASPGIFPYVTTFGRTPISKNTFTFNGKININTADVRVLMALLPAEYGDLAEAIHGYRMETSDSTYVHGLLSPEWYKNAPGCSDLEIDPDLIAASSDVFRIESTAVLHGMKLINTAVVARVKNNATGKWTCTVLRQWID
jgi:general secretion pathway protein K